MPRACPAVMTAVAGLALNFRRGNVRARNMRLRTFRDALVVAAACLLATTCTRRSEPPASKTPVSADASSGALRRPEIAGEKPAVVAGAVPVAAFVSEQLALAPAKGVTLVSVGASWCEPCQRFHRALAAGELDAGLAGY